MKARPKTTAAELKKLLPRRLGGEQLDTPGLEHHAQLVALDADPLARVSPPDADGENRTIAAAMRDVIKGNPTIGWKGKPIDSNDPVTGPRFVMTWRMYPNALNAHVQTSGQCGCGCSCVG
jgi:hypothetical protein